MGHLHGKLCQWWGILSLLILSCAWMWSYYPSRYIYTWLSTICRGTAVWYSSATEEDKKNEKCSDVVSQINGQSFKDLHLNNVNILYIFLTVTYFEVQCIWCTLLELLQTSRVTIVCGNIWCLFSDYWCMLWCNYSIEQDIGHMSHQLDWYIITYKLRYTSSHNLDFMWHGNLWNSAGSLCPDEHYIQ